MLTILHAGKAKSLCLGKTSRLIECQVHRRGRHAARGTGR